MPAESNLTGSILVAHPCLGDPNFRRTTVFVSRHSAEDGAMGLVLNRPIGGAVDGLPGIPMYYGGPVQPENILLASLQWRENPEVVAFRIFGGGEVPVEDEWRHGLRAFAGHSGWTAGQLEEEIEGKTWIVIPPTRDIIEAREGVWKALMRRSGPMFHLLSEAPDEPWNN
jgi:putative transcriptional regulator